MQEKKEIQNNPVTTIQQVRDAIESENNYFIKLSQLSKALAFIQTNKTWVIPDTLEEIVTDMQATSERLLKNMTLLIETHDQKGLADNRIDRLLILNNFLRSHKSYCYAYLEYAQRSYYQKEAFEPVNQFLQNECAANLTFDALMAIPFQRAMHYVELLKHLLKNPELKEMDQDRQIITNLEELLVTLNDSISKTNQEIELLSPEYNSTSEKPEDYYFGYYTVSALSWMFNSASSIDQEVPSAVDNPPANKSYRFGDYTRSIFGWTRNEAPRKLDEPSVAQNFNF